MVLAHFGLFMVRLLLSMKAFSQHTAFIILSHTLPAVVGYFESLVLEKFCRQARKANFLLGECTLMVQGSNKKRSLTKHHGKIAQHPPGMLLAIFKQAAFP